MFKNLLYNNLIVLILFESILVFGDTQTEFEKKYIGEWPVNSEINTLDEINFNSECPGDITCSCETNADCKNDNCFNSPRGKYCAPKVGDQIPHFIAQDQFGEMVDLYDFANQGKLVVVEMSAAWCSPCNDLAGWMTFDETAIQANRWWKPEYEKVKEKIRNKDIFFINIQYEDYYRDTSNQDSIEEWYSTYPEDNIPILMDNERKMHGWIRPSGLPCVFILDENMKFVKFTTRGLNVAFDYLVGLEEKKQSKTKEMYKGSK
jgi:thiol-disulfide isomerase/thioredoxin